MNRNPVAAQEMFDEQLCDFWLRDDFNAWATGVGFMSSLFGHPELRDAMKWLVSVRILKVEEGEWDELSTK